MCHHLGLRLSLSRTAMKDGESGAEANVLCALHVPACITETAGYKAVHADPKPYFHVLGSCEIQSAGLSFLAAHALLVAIIPAFVKSG